MIWVGDDWAEDHHDAGVTHPVTTDYLTKAAPGYLTSRQRAAAHPATWFTDATDFATTEGA